MNVPISTQVLRDTLATTAAVARVWFEERAPIRTRDQFESRGGLGDAGSGSVYVYFDLEGRAIYVGQTGRAVKARLHDQTSPHKKKPWWRTWTYLRFVPMADEIDRLILESLLIAGYEPSANEKPSSKPIADLFVKCNMTALVSETQEEPADAKYPAITEANELIRPVLEKSLDEMDADEVEQKISELEEQVREALYETREQYVTYMLAGRSENIGKDEVQWRRKYPAKVWLSHLMDLKGHKDRNSRIWQKLIVND